MLTRLPHRITIQTLTTAAWKGGLFTPTWATTTVTWANIYSKDKADVLENYDNIKSQQIDILNVILRKPVTLSKINNRFLYNGDILHIETKRDLTNRGKYIVCKCRLEEVT